MHSNAPVWHVGSFRKQNCVREEASIQKKHGERKLLCMCFFFFHLLTWSERYQFLHFLGHTFFHGLGKNKPMGFTALFPIVWENYHHFAQNTVGVPGTLVFQRRMTSNDQRKGIAKWNYQTYPLNTPTQYAWAQKIKGWMDVWEVSTVAMVAILLVLGCKRWAFSQYSSALVQSGCRKVSKCCKELGFSEQITSDMAMREYLLYWLSPLHRVVAGTT